MMKLIYVANIRLPTEKAHGYQIMKTCEAIAASGIELRLLATNRTTQIQEDPFTYYRLAKSFPLEKLSVLDYQKNATRETWQYLAFMIERWSFGRSLKKWFRQFHGSENIYYSRDVYAASLLKKLGATVFLELHALSIRQRAALSSMDGITCVTKWLSSEVQQHAPSVATDVIPDGVDLTTFQPIFDKTQARKLLGIDSCSKMILYGGRFSTLNQGKGLAVLDRAVQQLEQTDGSTRLYLVGGTREEYIRIEKKPPSAKTFCIPEISREKLALYYRAADVLVMPFPNTHHYAYEMSPLKLFEYMASGTPIVTSNLPSVREILESDEAIFYEPENLDSLRDAIQTVLKQKEVADLRAMRLAKRAATFTWDARAQKITKFILSQLAKRAPL